MIRVFNEIASPVDEALFEKTAAACLKVQSLAVKTITELTLTDEEGIRRSNRDWRGMDEVTDVLSFPSLSLLPEHTLNHAHPGLSSVWDSEEGAYSLGDIVICVPRALQQAKEYGHSPEREFSYLFAHGLFHLMGYDHLQEEDRTDMREKEEAALAQAVTGKASDKVLLDLARKARGTAYAPYSKYRVGAALLGRSGKVYTGGNIENISYGLTNCAERTALFKAVSDGEKAFDTIAIAADGTAPWPCGACRQVLSEFAPRLRVLITWEGEKTAESTLDALLPHSFLEFTEDSLDEQ
jgi:cytidine deaminase